MAGRWSGEKDTGPRDFTPAERVRLVRYFRGELAGRANAQDADSIARACGLQGRTYRAICSEIDGVDLVIAQDDGLVWLAEYEDETEAATAQLYSRARRIESRAHRRRAMAAQLPRQQWKMGI